MKFPGKKYKYKYCVEVDRFGDRWWTKEAWMFIELFSKLDEVKNYGWYTTKEAAIKRLENMYDNWYSKPALGYSYCKYFDTRESARKFYNEIVLYETSKKRPRLIKLTQLHRSVRYKRPIRVLSKKIVHKDKIPPPGSIEDAKKLLEENRKRREERGW